MELVSKPVAIDEKGGSVEITDEMFDIGGRKVCVRICGDASGPAVVLLHGLQSHAGVWEKVAASLAQRGYFVVMPDRRGHGYSESFGSYHMFDYVSDLNFVTQAYVDGKFSLVGHCESCYLVACLAGAYPEKIDQLIMIQYPVMARTTTDISTKTDLIKSFLDKNSKNVTHVLMESVDEAVERSRSGAPFPMPVDVAYHVAKRNIVKVNGDRYSWRWDTRLLDYRVLYNTHDLDIIQESIKRVDAPVKFIHGVDSTLIEINKDRILDTTSKLNSNASQHMVSGGHYPHLEHAFEQVVEVITA